MPLLDIRNLSVVRQGAEGNLQCGLGQPITADGDADQRGRCVIEVSSEESQDRQQGEQAKHATDRNKRNYADRTPFPRQHRAEYLTEFPAHCLTAVRSRTA